MPLQRADNEQEKKHPDEESGRPKKRQQIAKTKTQQAEDTDADEPAYAYESHRRYLRKLPRTKKRVKKGLGYSRQSMAE